MTTIAFNVFPEETLYFGPPASLPAGESHHGQSLFPPPSSSWQGIVRTRFLESSGLDLQRCSQAARQERAALVGGPDELPAGWSIEGPVPVETLLNGHAQGWFPTPLWIHRRKDGVTPDIPPQPLHAVPLLLRDQDATLKSDLPFDPVPIGVPPAGRTTPLGGWLHAADLLAVLSGRLPGILSQQDWERRRNHWDLPPFVRWETRPGLALDGSTGTAAEGMLYFLKTLRFSANTGLAGWFSGDLPTQISANALHEGSLTVGRKACTVRFGQLKRIHQDWRELMDGSYLPDEVPQDPFDFWLYLASSAHLEDPVKPTLHPPGDGMTLEVRGSLLRKPLWLGGFSVERQRARANLPYVPAGSGWLLRLHGGTPGSRGNALKEMHRTNILVAPARAAFGEGRSYVGLLPSR